MKGYRRSKSTLFLLELIFSIFFFAITSAVCAQIFARAHVLSSSTADLNHAIVCVESAAEIFHSGDGSFTTLTQCFPEAKGDEDQLIIYYDRQWAVTDSDDAIYTLTIDRTTSGQMTEGTFVCMKDGKDEPIYSLSVNKYSQQCY